MASKFWGANASDDDESEEESGSGSESGSESEDEKQKGPSKCAPAYEPSALLARHMRRADGPAGCAPSAVGNARDAPQLGRYLAGDDSDSDSADGKRVVRSAKVPSAHTAKLMASK